MPTRIVLAAILLGVATRLCFPPCTGRLVETTIEHMSLKADTIVKSVEWPIAGRWRFATADLSQERFLGALISLAAERDRKVTAESLAIQSSAPSQSDDPLAKYRTIAVQSAHLDSIRAPYQTRIEASFASALAAETAAYRQLNVPLARLRPRYESRPYGWASRDYSFTFEVNTGRLQIEGLVAALLFAAIALLAPILRQRVQRAA